MIVLVLMIATCGGPCERVIDGDTLAIRQCSGELVRVRIHGIDAPELKQPGGEASATFAATLASGQYVELIERGRHYKRLVADVLIDGVDFGDAMIRAGHAWQYREYDKSPHRSQLQHDAKRNRRGLWRQANSVEPWNWRRGNSD